MFVGSQLPHCAASWFTWSDEEAYFILSYLSGDILLIKQLQNGACDSIDLKFESIVPRFLHGLAEKFRFVCFVFVNFNIILKHRI